MHSESAPPSRILVFIVAYNHERLLEVTVSRIPSEILANPNCEVLIIDDASTDSTFDIAKGLRDRHLGQARFTALKNPVNQGYGGNQKLGYHYAIDHGFTHVILVHGDGQYAPELLPQFIKRYSSASAPDAIFGTRMSSWRSALKGGMPLYKLIGNTILTFIQNRLLGSELSEFHSGYRSYSTELLRRIPFDRNSNDFHFDTEIIIQILALGKIIQEFPIPTHYGDEICHVNGFEYAWNVFMSSLHFRLQKLGFLYDRRFDVGLYDYPEKPSPYSSHSMLIESVSANQNVLDIGCGTGGIARSLIKNKNCKVYGVDILPANEGPSVLQRYWSIDLNRNLEGLRAPLIHKHYDVILLADILEHMLDPEHFLDFLRAACIHSYEQFSDERANVPPRLSKVHATTGNVAFLIVRFMLLLGQFNYGPKGILDRTHTRLFSRRSFIKIFEQCGFRVVRIQPIPLPFTAILSPTGLLGRTLERLNLALCRVAPGLFAYQFLLEVEVLPTVDHLLRKSRRFSQDLEARLPGDQRELG